MANLNKVMLIGRLTRDPEMRSFSNGGRVAKFGFAVNNRKKNMQTGEWEEEPVFLECDAFNRGEFGKLADTIERYLRKGSQAYTRATSNWNSNLKTRPKAVETRCGCYAGVPDSSSGWQRWPSAIGAGSTSSGPSADPSSDYHDAPAEVLSGGGGQDGDIPFDFDDRI